MISIGEALDIIKANLPRPAVADCLLAEALGRHLAGDVVSPEPSPRYTNSAMDGFAARWEDIEGASAENPVTLRLVGESRAGHPFSGEVGKGQAIRISTGAVFGNGCDTVVKVEDTRQPDEGSVSILDAGERGQHIRHAGEEFKAGDVLLTGGTRISAAQIALLASVGLSRPKVYRPVRVAILVTGSELVSVGQAIEEHQIRDSNMIMLQSAVLECGAEVVLTRRVSDDEGATRAAIAEASADIVLCSGGVSMGEHDHVRTAAEAVGYAPLFWRIRQKPGKPLYFARKGDTLLFGLPGNPVSAFLCFAHYVRPVIAALKGMPFDPPTIPAQAAANIPNRGKRANMMRGRLARQPQGCLYFTPAPKQNSHMLTSLTDANGYIILEPGQTLPMGGWCEVYRYDFSEEPI